MADLILDSLEIENFRTFRHLKIEHLGRVNLITGHNNVGKTSLLEAIWLYALRGRVSQIQRLLTTRNEMVVRDKRDGYMIEDKQNDRFAPDIRHLFYGRKAVFSPECAIRIGPAARPEQTFRLQLEYIPLNKTSEGNRAPVSVVWAPNGDHLSPYIVTYFGEQGLSGFPIELMAYPIMASGLPDAYPTIPSQYVATSGINEAQLNQLWDAISLNTAENDVIKALQLIADVERVNVIGDMGKGNGRIAIAKLQGQEEPVPLRSLGDGMNRLFGIALALVNSRNGILLIDEVENGLHYSVQPDVWKLIFEVAVRLNVQVFATTHSWDCITAFQQAAQMHPQTGVLVRLRNRNGHVADTLWNEDDLGIATREGIEVR